MTLASELLKRQRPEAVLLYLDDWSKICRPERRTQIHL